MCKLFVLTILTYVLFNINSSNSAKILGIFPSPGYSQYILAEPLLVALAKKGHNVTVISYFKTDGVQNLRSIAIDKPSDVDALQDMLYGMQDLSLFVNLYLLRHLCLELTKDLLADQNVQALINSEESFDLVIVETFLTEALQAFAPHFNAHQVLFSSTAISEWNSNLIGVPNIPSYLPTTFSQSTTYMNLYERFRNTISLFYSIYYRQLYSFPEHQLLVDKYFPKKYILEDFIYNASLLLASSHVSTSETVPVTASVVEIGGLHIKTNKLPDNIQKLLDSAKDGAIFFSMGSNIHSSSMSKEVIQQILSVIRSLKQKVLWKFEDENLENKPDNLIVSKWFPQTDILAHPNLVAFISHCGFGSTTEAVYHGVPVVGIPVYGDQPMNIRRLVQHGMAIEVPFKQLSARTLNDSLQDILYKSEYREAAQRRSRIMKDRAIQPLDEAVYWVEYVLRHDGAHHLKSSVLTLRWYQLYLIDILAITFVSLVLTIYIIYILLRRLTRSALQKKTKVH